MSHFKTLMDSKDQMRTRIWKETFGEDITPYRAPCVFFFYCSGHQHSAVPLFFFVVFAFLKFQRIFLQRTSLLFAALVRSVSMGEDWVLAGCCSTLVLFLACVTIRTNFLKCFAVRGVWNVLQPQISVTNVVSNLIWVKAASSVDNEKLLKEYFHWGYP